MADFKDFINKIENKIGNSITRQTWSATLNGITERNNKSIKISVTFTKGDFSFVRELKLVEQHFSEESKYNDEIVRLLKRLNDFDSAMSELTPSDPPNITGKWKGYLTANRVVTPTHNILTFTYAQRVNQEIISFEKDVNVFAESFMSKQSINGFIKSNEDILNQPIDITYYQNLI